jgi:beta-lactamase regulating signal transducer with metallopeptidase domain
MFEFIELIVSIPQIWFGFIIKQLIISFVLFLFIISVNLFLKKKLLWFQLSLWLLIYLRLVIPPEMTWKLNIADYFDPNIFKSSTTNDLALSRSNNFIYIATNEVELSSESNDTHYLSERQPIVENPINATNSEDKKVLSLDWLTISLFLVWLVGVFYTTVAVKKKLNIIKTYRNNAKPIEDIEILNLIKKWKSKLRLKQNIQIFSSELIPFPFATGIINPKIYMSQQLIDNLKIDEIEPIIAHEMTHIKRKDLLIQKIQMFMNILYFFNPIIWYSNSRINQLREHICDLKVLEKSDIKPRFYSQVMVNVLQQSSTDYSQNLFPAITFGDHENKLKRRIQMILNYSNKRTKHNLFIFILLFSIMLSGAFSIGFKQIVDENVKTITGIHPHQKTPFEIRIIEEDKNTFSGIMRFYSERKPAFSYIEGNYFDKDSMTFQEKLFFLDMPVFRPEFINHNGYYTANINKNKITGGIYRVNKPDVKNFSGEIIDAGESLTNIEKDTWELFRKEKDLLLERNKLRSQLPDYYKIRAKKDSIDNLLALNGFKLLKLDYPYYNKYKGTADSNLVIKHFRVSLLRCQEYVDEEHHKVKKDYIEKIIPVRSRFYYQVQEYVLDKTDSFNSINYEISKEEKELNLKNYKERILNIDENKLHPTDKINYLYSLSGFIKYGGGGDYKNLFLKKYENIKNSLPKNEDNLYHIYRNSWGILTPTRHLELGTPAPNFSFSGSNNEIKSLSDYKGKVVYLLFWSDYNRLYKLKSLKNIERNINNDQFKVLFVYLNEYKKAINYCQNFDIPWNPIKPVNGLNSDIANKFQMESGIGLIIDKSGLIRARRNPGFKELEDRIKKLL